MELTVYAPEHPPPLPVLPPAPAPWQYPISTAALYRRVRIALGRHTALVGMDAVIAALWIMNSYVFRTFPHCPRLVVGGSRNAARAILACCHRPVRVAHMAPAAVLELAARYQPTILVSGRDPVTDLLVTTNAGSTLTTAIGERLSFHCPVIVFFPYKRPRHGEIVIDAAASPDRFRNADRDALSHEIQPRGIRWSNDQRDRLAARFASKVPPAGSRSWR